MYPLIYLKLVRCTHRISQSPGYENVASLNLPINAPAIITVERICLIKSSGISVLFISFVLISTFALFFFTFAPKSPKIFNVICVSWIFGTLYSFVVLPLNILPAIIGSEAFLEPDIGTVPSSFLPPSIM